MLQPSRSFQPLLVQFKHFGPRSFTMPSRSGDFLLLDIWW
jgi:hypothetical protein